MDKSWIAVVGMAVGMAALAGCSDSAIGAPDTDSGQAVALASPDDVLRELGSLGSGLELQIAALAITQSTTGGSGGSDTPTAVRSMRARLAAAQAPRATPVNVACSGGGTDTRTTDSKSRAFSYFSFNGPVDYQLDAFSNCVSSSDEETDTINGSAESGHDASSDMVYAVLGTGGTSMHLMSTSGDTSFDRGLLGTVEAQEMKSTSDTVRAVLQGTSTVKTGSDQTNWQMSLGDDSTPFAVAITSSSFSFNGPYAYTGSATGCGGGNVTVATPTPLTEASADQDQDSFTGGVLTISSGSKSVTVTINSDGTATLSGNVSGTLTKDQFNGALLGSTCIPLNTLGG